MNEKPLVFKPKRCKKCGLEFGLITAGIMVDHETEIRYCPCCGAEIETLQNKITYQPVDDYKECNFYKDGEKRDIAEVDDYYLPHYCGNPFREGKMSGLWGEYEYYCAKCNLEITKVFYDSEHIKVGDCSKCPKCKESD